MMAMPIWLSIDSAKLCRNTSGSAIITSASAPQPTSRLTLSTGIVAVFGIATSFIGRLSFWRGGSSLASPEQPGGTHDQHQHHEQIRQHRGGLRNGDG